jgi:hypothetical protein
MWKNAFGINRGRIDLEKLGGEGPSKFVFIS